MSRIPRLRVRTAVILGFVVLAACGRKEGVPTPDSTGRTSLAPSAARPARVGSGPVLPGALSKPIDQYTGDEFYTFTQSLHFVGSHERLRKCKNSQGCGGLKPIKTTLVQVSAVATQDSLSAATTPEFGVVYLRAINRGDAEEARYGLLPDKGVRYYAIIQRDSSGGMRWRLEQLDTNKPRKHMQVASGEFHACGHAWQPGARADFKSCEAAERGDTVATMSLMFQTGDGDPAWTACAEGCCIFR